MCMSLPPKDERIEIRVPSEDADRWRATADAENMTLSDWIRRRCNEVAVSAELIRTVEAKKREREAAKQRR